MSSYPEAFKLNCVGKLPTDNTYSVCQQKPIILENNNLAQGSNYKPQGCPTYEPPREVIQSNNVDFTKTYNKSWSNTRGYGNIVVGTHDTCNNIQGRVHPWNRINPLSSPHDTPVVIKDAWSMNKVRHVRK
uniref:Uncharacterized protein n=1 Tax=viral metagenome TaxID=1070528 RepID=A0A6C0JIA6_9ZZZZ